MAKKLFELERERDALRAEHHETAGKETEDQRAKRSAKITVLVQQISDFISTGAKEHPKGVKPIGMKVRPGVYEVGNGELRSRGETPEEAVQNWNDGVY